MSVQIRKWLVHPEVWRFVGFASTVLGLLCYALSSSFNHLFGEWNLLKILLYTAFSFIICLGILFARLWQHSTSLLFKSHLAVLVLTATSMYSSFFDKAVNGKPDAYSLISCTAFAIMSLGLSTQIHLGCEVDLLYFFLGFLIVQLMKIKWLLATVGAGFSYSLVMLRSFLDAHTSLESGNLGLQHDVVIQVIQVESHSQQANTTDSGRHIVEIISSRNVKHVLVACAEAIAVYDLLMAQRLMDELRQMVSVSGEPIQRLGAYMLEGLCARLEASGSSIYKALKYNEPVSDELLSYTLYEICPYFKFGYHSAMGAISEAMKDEDRVHIIDFQIAQGTQWINLIQAFAMRPGGPPHIRITGIDNSASASARRGGLSIVGQRLSKQAERVKVPFEFHAAAMSGCDVQLQNLGVQPGEAIAVNFAFMLHDMPDDSVSTQNHRDRLLRLVKSLSPKVVTLVEQESDTNTAPFLPRFLETLDYYTAIFESIDVTLPRDHEKRINVERHCLAREIVNVIACEGVERVERHELLGKWKSRFAMAGFTPYPLSSLVNGTAKALLKNYSDTYRVEERDGALYLGWLNRDLVASCAWK